MPRQPFKFPQVLFAALCAAILSALAPVARADVASHTQVDSFVAEITALLPPGEPPVAALTAPADRITLGEWGDVIPWTPHIPVSAASLPDGRVLTFASNERTTFPNGPERTFAATWDPATGQFAEFNHPSHDMFCGGIVTLPDGRVLVTGGNVVRETSLFDWRDNTWTRTADLNDQRWYNTAVALPNGRVWTVSGTGGPGTAERWDSATGWSRQTGINWNLVTAEPGYINIWHPLLTLAPDGRLIHFGPTDTMHWVNTEGSGSFTNAGAVVPGPHYPKESAWAMYDEGRILVAGGGANTTANPLNPDTGTSTNAAYTVDVRTVTPVVTSVAPMNFVRQFGNSVILPTGEVLIIGGNDSGLQFSDVGWVRTPEIWNPTTGQWRVMATNSVPRTYHSVALLLPDGRVLSGGGGLPFSNAESGGNHQDAQLFTPPMLFNADGSLATRPTLTTAPGTIGVATTFDVTGTPGIPKFSFIKMSAITHSVNTDLRYLSLPFTETTPGNYQISAHTNLNVMTPGYWMLFGVNTSGVYSVAKIILVDSTSSVSIAPPGSQASYIDSAVSLQMIGNGPAGHAPSWSATGLPTGLVINGDTGLISGTPTVAGTFPVQVGLTDNHTAATANFVWIIQPLTLNQNYPNFTGASGLTLNSNTALASDVLRLTPNTANRVGSAFLTDPITVGPDTSISTRWVFRAHGTANGGEGLTFIIQGNGPTSIGTGGTGLGYGGMTNSIAVEIDSAQGTGDPNTNHLGILTNGVVTAHLATHTPGWDLENALSHTVWVEYDGPVNQLRVYAAEGVVVERPISPVMTATVDLPAFVGGQAWLGFSGGTSSSANNHDIESWSVTVNAFALPAPPVLTGPGSRTNVLDYVLNLQLQAIDPNGDLLTWSASNLPTGLSLNPSSGLVSGTPTALGVFATTITVTDSNFPPVTTNFTWTINDLLAIQPLSGTSVLAGTTVALTAQTLGGLNPQYSWNFGDGTPDTAFAVSPATSHQFPNPGRYLITVTVRDDRESEVTASYYQAVYAQPTTNRPTASASIVYESRTNANARLWVVNPDNDSVTVFDAITHAKLAEINVGNAPRTLALAPDGRVWVANNESATVTIIQTNYTIAQTVNLPRGSKPFGLVFDPAGLNAYVALEGAGKLLRLDPATGATQAALDVGPNVRHLSVTADAAQILATRFITPRLPGEETASPQTTVLGVKYGGEVVTINRASFTIVGTVILEHSEESDTSSSARGIPNYLGAAAISPDGQSAWVPSKQDNIKRGLLRSGSVLTHDMSVRSIASRINLATLTEVVAGRIDFDDGGIASAAAFDPQGIFLFTALEGSREVAVADAFGNQEILRFPAGRAPQGLVLSPDGRTLFVQNFMDRTITIHDLTALAYGSLVAPPAPVVLDCVTTEKLAAQVLVGKQFFYDSSDNRLALQQYISCAACHNDGGQDGRIWDFTEFGEGLRNTITLRGHGGTAQGPLHWTGNFDEVQDFEGQIRNFAFGTGLMSNNVFHAGTRSQPLGDTKAGFSPDLDALAAYVASLTKNDDSPDRNTDGTLTSAALAGQGVFIQQNCIQCHAGTQFTDSALNVFHNVGTLKPSSGQRLGAALTGLDTPTLLGVWATAPYLHDGSAATLEAAVSAHGGVTLGATALANLSAFLRQLDDGPLPESSFGNTNNGFATDGIGNGYINAARFQATTDMTVTKMHAQVEGVAGRYKCAIYSNSGNQPNVLLRTSTEITNPSTGWHTFTLTTPLSLTNGQTYWLSIWSDDAAARVFYSDNAGLIRWELYSYGAWPNPVVMAAQNNGGYTYCIYASGTAMPRQLTVTGITANHKIYDGNTTASLNLGGATLVGVLGGDVVTLNTNGATGVFNTAAVGTGKLVQIAGLSLSGAQAGNYTLVQPTTTANVTLRPVTPVIGASHKVYDSTTTATLTNQSVTGTVGADVVTLGVGAANFATGNVGTNKTVTATNLSLGGPSAGNYVLGVTIATNTANIMARGITGDFTAASRPYDGTPTATVLTRTLGGVLAADLANVSLNGGTASFADANAGVGKLVTLTGAALLGSASGNYNLTAVDTATANITALNITGDFTADNKPYDGNTNATVLTRTLDGVLPGDIANVSLDGGTASFVDANVGVGKLVTLTGAKLLGSASTNYTLSSVDTATANITALSITGDFTADNKPYDGNTNATVLTRTLNGVLTGDIANVGLDGGTASFTDANVGVGKLVTLTGATLLGSASTNYTLSSVDTATANITALNLTGDFTADNKPYDGNTNATVLTRTLDGVLPTDIANVSLDGGTASFADANVGLGKIVTLTGATLLGSASTNYSLGSVDTATANITALNITGDFTADNKPYDGNTNATVLTRTLDGVLPADIANVSLDGGTASFADANVGLGKTVTLTGATLLGSASTNYNLSSVDTATANITALNITGDFTADNKPYDGSTNATVLTRTLDGVLSADIANVSLDGGTAGFADANVGIGKLVTLTGATLLGSASTNYTLSSVDTATANITALNITGDFTADNKPYDGSTNATVLARTLDGVLAGDIANVSLDGGTASFADANVGLGKIVTLTGATLLGSASTNYSLGSVDTATANITALNLTGDFTADNKPYDGNTNATVLTRTLNGVLAGDIANVSLDGGTASFVDANVGIGKLVTLTGATLLGSASTNYNLTSVDTATASITALNLTGDFTADNKHYDGSTNATVLTRTLDGVLTADIASVSLDGGTATFADANVGVGKTVTLTGATLLGSASTNYSLSSVDTATANITALNITGDFTADNKPYDGNPNATVLTRTLDGVLAGDIANVSLDGGTASFVDANVGIGKLVTLTGATLLGSASTNYTLSSVDTATANITVLNITGDFTADNKPYDGNTNATVLARTLDGVLTADIANVSLDGGTASFVDANVGIGKLVTLTGATLLGSASTNYTLSSVDTATANITALNLTGDFTADNKPYDGNTNATVLTRTLDGVLTADIASVSLDGGTATFADANVGVGKTVTLTGATLLGSASTNYSLSSVDTATANITALNITGDFTADNKPYDGNTNATVLTRTLDGVLPGDLANVSLDGGTASFVDANVGIGKTVTLTGATLLGSASTNYSLSSVDTALASITAFGITGDFTADNKPYDGNTNATVSSRTLDGVLTADIANVSLDGGTASFTDANVGIGKTVTLTGAVLIGSASTNYSLTSVDTATAAITAATLVVTADSQSRGYGLTNPVLTASYSGFAGGETLATSGVTGAPDLATTATNTSPAGNYPITAAIGSLNATNYSFSFAEGVLTITPPGDVIITSVVRLENNLIRFQASGGAGVLYTIQSSTNLVQWQDIGTATADESGTFEFEETTPADWLHGFYRIALP